VAEPPSSGPSGHLLPQAGEGIGAPDGPSLPSAGEGMDASAGLSLPSGGGGKGASAVPPLPLAGEGRGEGAPALGLGPHALVAIGGGKDSLVSIEALRAAGVEQTVAWIGGSQLIATCAERTGLPRLNIGRA